MTAPETTVSTRASLREEFMRLGVPRDGIVLVHSSLRAVGWIVGGPVTVVEALRDVLGPDGTIVVPTHTGHNRDPSRWVRPWIAEELWDRVRDAIPAFDPQLTPSFGLGQLAECVRTWPGARRSDHPQTSFAAIGPAAAELLAGHELTSPLGEQSPLRRLEEANGYALLLGTGYDTCTSFHLAEYRASNPPMQENACAVRTQRGREWVRYSTVALDDGDFDRLGEHFEQESNRVRVGPVGHATARLLPVAAAVAFASAWLPSFQRGAGGNRWPVGRPSAVRR